jgi:choline dehydrogenase-like flavoprotein
MAPLPEGMAALSRLLGKEPPDGSTGISANVLSVIRDLDDVASNLWGRAVLGRGSPVDAVIQHCHSEQIPNPDSRLTLAADRDALGCNRIAVDWRLTEDDKRHIDETHALLAAEIGRTGFGRMRYLFDGGQSRWPDDIRGNEHHMGTTRMHSDPKLGVVDAECRVHGLANLYIAGSSVFPTGGAANPTLTIVALAVRLADRIKKHFT